MELETLWKPAFCMLVTLGLGCAVSDYPLITDNDQTAGGRGSGIVNTNGRAHIRESLQIATIYPDGTDQLMSYVDQKANGDRTITTYDNYSTGAQPTFHDDLYCNPDWQGCAIVTAPDPEIGDVDIFDARINENCSGARAFFELFATGRYYGECGRARLSLSDRLALLNMGRPESAFGLEGLLYDLDRSNLSIVVDNHAGAAQALPISGSARLFLAADGTRRAALDLTDPMLGNLGRGWAGYLRAHRTHAMTAIVTYNGISIPFEIGGELNTPERVLSFVNRRY